MNDHDVRPMPGANEDVLLRAVTEDEKCGFAITGEDREYPNARGEDVEQFVMTLGTAGP